MRVAIAAGAAGAATIAFAGVKSGEPDENDIVSKIRAATETTKEKRTKLESLIETEKKIIHALEKHEEYVKKLGPFAETAKRMNNFIKRVKGSSEEKLKAANELFDFASPTDSATVKH